MPKVIEHLNTADPRTFIGKEINNFILMELLGRGAMGSVFVGYQKSLKRKVAVKVFPKTSTDRESYTVQFQDEAEIVGVLNHPNIVTVFDMGETDELLYIAMQLINGEDLRSMIHRHQLNPIPSKRQIDIEQVLSIMMPVLNALSYSHEEGVIHQDIKPANILIDERTRRPYLADFGIARSALNEDNQSNMILGTPLYIAPEQIREEPLDSRSDIYSSGIVLYEAIAGKLPFKTKSVEELLSIKLNDPDAIFTKTPSQQYPAIDTELEKIILKAIAPDKDKRYQSCCSFYQHLKLYAKNRFGRGDL